jgi:predicted metal-dependent phosphoesterase TrpH
MMVLNAAEGETDYGHMLVFGVNDDIIARFDFTDVRLNGQQLIDGVAAMGGAVIPCHPGRPNIGLCDHYQSRPPLRNVTAVEVLNGGSRRGEDERCASLASTHGYRAVGGSDSHMVSLIGLCATRFAAGVRDMDGLVRELTTGLYEPVDYRPARPPVRRAQLDEG